MLNTAEKRERFYLKMNWIVMIVVLFFLYSFQGTQRLFGADLIAFKVWVLAFIISVNLAKTLMVYSGKFESEKYFYFYRMLEVVLFVAIAAMFDTKPWLYIALAFPIMAVSMSKGAVNGILIAVYSAMLNFLFLFALNRYFLGMKFDVTLQRLNSIYFYYLIIFLLPFVTLFEFKIINSLNLFKSNKNKEDIQENINRLLESSQVLEDSNSILEDTNAELYTVQCIVKEINVILDFKNLVEKVVDIIIGVTGAKSVSIFALKEKSNRFNLIASTLKDSQIKLLLEDYANMDILKNLLNHNQLKYFNNVDINDEVLSEQLNISSIMTVPINNLRKEEGIIFIEHHLKNYFSDDLLRFMDVISQQISLAFEKVSLYEKMHELAIKDGLTGIYNRIYFQDRLKKEIKNANQNNFELAIVLFDIDHFKAFNDTYGHMVGDDVIKHIVRVVENELRKDDVFARFGGEEFVIIFSAINNERAVIKTECIRKKLEEAYLLYGDKKIKVTASFGLASYPISGLNEDDLLKKADEALYEAKKSGRNCVWQR